MSDDKERRARRAWMCIGGFGCCQGFVLSVLYLGLFSHAATAAWRFPCDEVVATLAFMVAAFALTGTRVTQRFACLLEVRSLLGFSVLPIFGGLLYVFASNVAGVWVAQGACIGFPAGLMLGAWGRLLGCESIARSVPEVFIGSAFGAVLGLVLGLIPLSGVRLALLLLLPLASMLVFRLAAAQDSCAFVAPRAACPQGGVDKAGELSAHIIAGTAMYGFAAGLAVVFGFGVRSFEVSQPAFVLLLFALYCLAALQLFGANPLAGMRSVLPMRGDDAHAQQGGPLDGAYRLAILLMMAGFLLVPVLERFGDLGCAVVIAGYMGILSVLISLFLIMARIGDASASHAFAVGFSVLFVGQIGGIVVGDALYVAGYDGASDVIMAAAGVAVIYGYLFLFTERDLRALSIVVERVDRFEEACATIAARAALSKREAEILPLALRGRTSERIASEMFITKNTVDTHMRRIYAKCGVHNRQELIDLGERTQHDLEAGVGL